MTTVTAKIQQQIEAEKKKAAERIKQLTNKLQAAEARKVQALIKGKRSDDTRRKILAGAVILKVMEANEETKRSMLSKLSAELTRDDDRALFGLPPLSPSAALTKPAAGTPTPNVQKTA